MTRAIFENIIALYSAIANADPYVYTIPYNTYNYKISLIQIWPTLCMCVCKCVCVCVIVQVCVFVCVFGMVAKRVFVCAFLVWLQVCVCVFVCLCVCLWWGCRCVHSMVMRKEPQGGQMNFTGRVCFFAYRMRCQK